MAKRRAKKRRDAAVPRFGDIVDAYQRDLEAMEQSKDPAERQRALQKRLSGYALAHLRRFFGKHPVRDIQSSLIVEYAMRRQDRGAAVATINGELRTLWQLTLFASRSLDLNWSPVIEYLTDPEAAHRRGEASRASRRWLEEPYGAVAGEYDRPRSAPATDGTRPGA